jgi:MFS transporter, UMF1 family
MLDQRRSIWSWAFYDWANSAFATTVMAGFFPIFFKAYWANPDAPGESTFYLGLANSLASIIVAALAPFLGAVADRATAKKKFLMLFAFLGVIMSGSLWMVAQGHWQMAAAFYVLATVGFSGGNIFYDSLLPGVASAKKVDYVSSLGFSMGYIGGGLLFLVNVVMYLKPELFGFISGDLAAAARQIKSEAIGFEELKMVVFGLDDRYAMIVQAFTANNQSESELIKLVTAALGSAEAAAIKASFLSVAVWWGLFSIPIILFVEEPKLVDSVPIHKAFKLGWLQLLNTLKEIRHLKVVGLFLLAYWFYIDGVDTIIRMAVDYGSSLGFPASSLITALLMVQFVAFPATLVYGWYTSKVGPKNAVYTGIFAYSIFTILGYFMTTVSHFYMLAFGIGLFQGGIQAISRSLYSRIIPKDKAAEFYGFFNMLGKFAAVLGPAMMGTITMVTGNVRYGILSVLLLFIAGGILLRFVDIKLGEETAKKHLAG